VRQLENLSRAAKANSQDRRYNEFRNAEVKKSYISSELSRLCVAVFSPMWKREAKAIRDRAINEGLTSYLDRKKQ
jgi:hypothetical protein